MGTYQPGHRHVHADRQPEIHFNGAAEDHNENGGFSLAFGPSGNLYVTGYGNDSRMDYGTLDLTTGAFAKISASQSDSKARLPHGATTSTTLAPTTALTGLSAR